MIHRFSTSPNRRQRDEQRKSQSSSDEARRLLDTQRLELDQAKLSLDRTKFVVETLLKEHKNRFDEVILHSTRYHKQVNFIQLYLTVVGSFIAVLFSKDWAPIQQSLSVNTVAALKSTLLTIAALISLYLFTNVMDALYAIYMNGRRLADLEHKINREMGTQALTWDSVIVPKLYSIDKFFIGAWVRPNILVGLWSFTFFIGVSLGLCAAAYLLVEPFFYYFAPITLFFSSVTLLNWFLLHREGLRFIDSAISGMEHSPDKVSILYVIVIANILLGYFPMLLFSIRDGAFCGPPHAFPFCSLLSVSLGDLVLIPFIAYQSLLFLSHTTIRKIWWHMSFVMVFCAVGTYFIHQAWIADQYTGFMDVVLGKISSAGIVHAVYTFVHASLISLFVVVFAVQHRLLIIQSARRSAYRAFSALMIFFLLGVVDAVDQYFRVFSGTLGSLFSFVWPSLLPLIFSAALALYTAKAIIHPTVRQVDTAV